MHSGDFLQDLAVVMIVAALVMVVFRKLRQPVVLGYILAGVIIGPHTPPYSLIHDEKTINTLSELGVILLMFCLGLEFSLRKLTKVGAPALLAAVMEIFLLFWLGYEVGHFFGWSTMDSIFLGAMLSMSSTTVIIKVLGDLGLMKKSFSQLVFGILIIEDILGIAMIALLSGIAVTGTLGFADVGLTLGRLSIFLSVLLVAGLIVVPRLIAYVARFKSDEMLVITVLGLCFGVSLLAMKLGYSVALGAFVIGAVIAEAREIHRIETLIAPVRDMFSAIFFVAIGLLIDPAMLVLYWKPILVISLAVIVGKILTCSAGAFLGGNDSRNSLRVGMSLAQIGEFSFIIASLGVTLKVTSGFLYPIAVAVSALTTLTTPYLIRATDATADGLQRFSPGILSSTLGLYTEWIGKVGAQRSGNMARKLLWKWGAQIALNVLLIAGLFVVAAYLGANPPGWLTGIPLLAGVWLKPALWLLAGLVMLPSFIASARKLQAMGLLLAETKVTPALAGANTASIRALVAAVVPLVGSVALGLFVLALSSTLIPSMPIFLGMLLTLGLAAWFLWRFHIRVYSSAQAALRETFARSQVVDTPHEERGLEQLPREMKLQSHSVAEGSMVAGKLIRELALRSSTGASIVCVERGESSLMNPGPDEELAVGDRLVLLGTTEQLHSAEAFLERRLEE